jgi:hypothetical protein
MLDQAVADAIAPLTAVNEKPQLGLRTGQSQVFLHPAAQSCERCSGTETTRARAVSQP